ncbi:hypothetical protein RND71_043603 [Anisodus tanguticus]|uniref:RCC1-like domain-containing protein n=1 Tax=Anisodus tanguticus TaxID=243964 RepID=A0AAE1QSA1_9SOLA|nr:hypothetical protein RND71_043603 [Anisodus tanguticus]
MPQKKKISESNDHSDSELSNKKLKSEDNGKEKNGKEISDSVTHDDQSVDSKTDCQTGCLLICGGVNWDLVGRKELPKAQRNCKNISATPRNLFGPHVWSKDIKLRSVHSSCGAAHSIIVSEDYKAYVFGRNDKNQLGLGDTDTRNEPVLVESLSKYKVYSAAVGRNHSLFLTDSGVFACGDNKMGQCGVGNQNPNITTPTKINYNGKKVEKMACGGDFSMILDSSGSVYSFGSPEFGQLGYGRLGHNDTKNELVPRNLKTFDYQNKGEATMYPKPIQDLGGWNIRSVACANKSIVVCADESVISWGPSPTFGELGYGENKARSSTIPQELKTLEGIHVHSVSCGYSHTLFLARNNDSKEIEKIQKLPQWP